MKITTKTYLATPHITARYIYVNGHKVGCVSTCIPETSWSIKDLHNRPIGPGTAANLAEARAIVAEAFAGRI